MLRDHVTHEQMQQEIADTLAGKIERPVHAAYRRAQEGEVCGGCALPLPPGSPVMVALADGSVGHAECHAGVPRGTGVRMRRNLLRVIR